MLKCNPLNSNWKLRLKVFLAVGGLLWIPLGCGSKNADTVAAPAASTTAANNVSTPVSTGNLSTNTSTNTGGLGPVLTPTAALGYGPADGQSGQPPRVLTLGMSNTLGVDQRLRVRMQCIMSPGRMDPYSGQVVGGQSNYNTLATNLTLLINGVTYQTVQVAATNCTQPSTSTANYSGIVDFSSSVYQALAGKPAANIQIIISNVKSDYKLISGSCYNDQSICLQSGYSYQYCASTLSSCLARVSPYSPVNPYAGWAFNLQIETDTSARF